MQINFLRLFKRHLRRRARRGQIIVDKLISNAKSIVKVRRVGDVKGDDSEAILARMEQRVKMAEWGEAFMEGAQLKGIARAKISPWLKQVDGRLKIEQAMQGLEEKIISALSGVKTDEKAQPIEESAQEGAK